MSERLGQRVSFSDPKVEEVIRGLFAQKLTAENCVRITLLQHPRVESLLTELSIGQAELVQAGLLKNPSFSFGITAWEQEHISPNVFASVEQDFLDILSLPLRKKIAATEFEATKLEVAHHVLGIARDVRSAYYTAVAAKQLAEVRRSIEEAQGASAEIARRQHAAGNMSELALVSERGLLAQASLDRKRAELDAFVAREALNKAMGTWGVRATAEVADVLSPLPPEEPPISGLEQYAIAHRLDMMSARYEVSALEEGLRLAKATRWTGSLQVGLLAGRLRHSGRLSFGPSATIEIPLFDQRQAQIAKLETYVLRAQADLRALAIDIRADVRAAQAKVISARSFVEDYARVILPLRERTVALSQERYDAMLLGVYPLLAAKQSEYDAYRAYIEALRDYWIARSDRDQAVGQRAPSSTHPATLTPASAVAPPPDSHRVHYTSKSSPSSANGTPHPPVNVVPPSPRQTP